MKRALLISILAAFGAVTTVACSDSSDTLTNGTGGEGDKDKNEKDDEEEPVAKKNETKDPVKTPEKPKTETPKPANTGDQCTPDATEPAECAKCCARIHSPIQGCACGPGSQCSDACGDNLCNGGIPSFECGLCMLQSRCDFGAGEQDGAQGGIGDFASGELAQCLKQCASKQ